MSKPSTATVTRGEHVVYLDWLKFLVVYGILVYHASLPFSYTTWLIGSRDRSLILTGFTAFTFPWGIPLLFLLSGAGAYFGLRSTRATAFLRRRFLRLGLPLVVGVIVLSPLQAYFVNSVAPRNLDGILGYYANFLHSVRLDWTPEWLGHYGYHLWFLGYLLAITAVTLPLLEGLRSPRGRSCVAWLATFSQRRGGILVFAAPLGLSQVLLRDRFPTYQDWADLATYSLVFLSGYVMAADSSFTTAIRRNAGLALKLGLVSALTVGSMMLISNQHWPAPSPEAGVLYHITYNAFWSLNVWCWCICVLYIGVRWLHEGNKVMRYGSESAMPFYVIHHPVLVVLGSYIVAWNLPLWPRFFLLVGVGFTVTLAIYEFAVRRWKATRFLFGLTPLPRPVRFEADSSADLGDRRSSGLTRWRPGQLGTESPRPMALSPACSSIIVVTSNCYKLVIEGG